MSGIFGVVSKGRCVEDVVLGTFYNQHRAQDYCGVAFFDGGKVVNHYPDNKENCN